MADTDRPMNCWVMYLADWKLSLLSRSHLEPLLVQFRADLVFSARYDSYELTCVVHRGHFVSVPKLEVDPVESSIHIMVGAAGANKENAAYYDVPWQVVALMDYGYGRLHIHNASYMRFEFKRNRGRGVFDSTWIVSHHNWALA